MVSQLNVLECADFCVFEHVFFLTAPLLPYYLAQKKAYQGGGGGGTGTPGPPLPLATPLMLDEMCLHLQEAMTVK